MKHPDPKKHQLISFWKSGIRIVGCLGALAIPSTPLFSIGFLAMALLIAEIIGVYEELV